VIFFFMDAVLSPVFQLKVNGMEPLVTVVVKLTESPVQSVAGEFMFTDTVV
jgi:hypothetical protein